MKSFILLVVFLIGQAVLADPPSAPAPRTMTVNSKPVAVKAMPTSVRKILELTYASSQGTPTKTIRIEDFFGEKPIRKRAPTDPGKMPVEGGGWDHDEAPKGEKPPQYEEAMLDALTLVSRDVFRTAALQSCSLENIATALDAIVELDNRTEAPRELISIDVTNMDPAVKECLRQLTGN